MRRRIAAAVCLTLFGTLSSSSPVISQQKSAKACRAEWRANKANLANGISRREYMAQCRAGSARVAAKSGQIYSTLKELMESIIDPSADVLWNAVGTVVDQEGVHESVPKTPNEWAEVRHAAVRIVEGVNLLLMPGREAAPAGTKSEVPGIELEPAEIAALVKKNRKVFDAFAMSLQALGAEALRASDARDAAMLMDVGSRMEEVCESCHKTFWYPFEKLPTR